MENKSNVWNHQPVRHLKQQLYSPSISMIPLVT
jgi:hypothetical protein